MEKDSRDILSDEALIRGWNDANEALTKWKAYEMDLRQYLAKRLFPGPEMDKGTKRLSLGNGNDLTCTKKLNYTLIGTDEQIDAVLSQFTDTEAKLLVSWKPSLSVANFEHLDEDKQDWFGDILQIKPGTPSMEIKPAKRR